MNSLPGDAEEMVVAIEKLKEEVSTTIQLSAEVYGPAAAHTMTTVADSCFKVMDVTMNLLIDCLRRNQEIIDRLNSTD